MTLLICWKTLYTDQETTVRTRHGSKLGKEYKAVYCHSAYITILQNISCEMLGWNHAAQAGINNLRYLDDFSQIMADYEEKLKNLLMRIKEECEKLDWNSQ